jgi:probable phosphoglycerate mutase
LQHPRATPPGRLMRLCCIRHGRTEWNDTGRLQGQTDVPLSPIGREQVRGWVVPTPFKEAPCIASPLARARDTALLLGYPAPRLDDRLKEMSWGEFEGRTLADLRAAFGQAFDISEKLGLDFRAIGGESPREVAVRLAALLGELARTGADHVVICHKGLLRASIVLACGWDMLGKPPVRIEDDHALVFHLSLEGRLKFDASVDLRACR